MAERPDLVTHRNQGRDAAIVFIHGFGGNPTATWGRFPEFLVDDPRLNGWDVFSLGYHTGLSPDVLRGIWAAQPELHTLGDLLWTTAALPPLDRYRSLAIIGHSMGGLVVQHALLNPQFRGRVQHVFLFGTPSGGLRRASLFAFWKRQLRDMAEGGPFIRDLRERWSKVVGAPPPFHFWPIAGDEDEFVPRTSSVDPFGPPFRVVPGDHLSIVKPRQRESLSVQMVLQGITTGAAPDGPLESARLAVERGDFRAVIDRFLPHADEVDQDTLVQLALALDGAGRRDEAVRVLQARGDRAGTDVLGTLGGRIKRRWVGERRQADAELAQELYARGHALASARGDHGQAYYHAINLAFLALLHRRDVDRAHEWAADALAHCAAQADAAGGGPDRDAVWRAATEGEALLIQGRTDAALDAYRRAVDHVQHPWQALSMFWQGRLVADTLGDTRGVRGLDEVFGMAEPAEQAVAPPPPSPAPSGYTEHDGEPGRFKFAPPESHGPPAESAPPEPHGPPAESAPPESHGPPAGAAPPESHGPPAESAPPESFAPPAGAAPPADAPPAESAPPESFAPPAESAPPESFAPPAESAPPADAEPPLAAEAPPSAEPPSAGADSVFMESVGPEGAKTSAPPAPQPEPVLLGGSAPREARPGDFVVVQFAAYVAAAEEVARRTLQNEAAPDEVRLGQETDCRWPVGTRVSVRCTAPGLTVSTPVQEFTWDGDCRTLQWDVEVPADAPARKTVVVMEAFVHVDGMADAVQVARLRMQLQVVAGAGAAPDAGLQRVEGKPARKAFASYASQDKLDVLERVSSIARSTGMDVFVDRTHLRMGEEWEPALRTNILESDRFLLFWSEFAAASKWVRRELDEAVAAHGEDVLELHLLRHVDMKAIPENLRKYHFNDVYLLARDAELHRLEHPPTPAAG